MKHFLRKLDFYGKTPSFLFFGKEAAETCFGGLISFTIFVCFIIFSFIFGQDFLFRKRPRVISSFERPINSTVYRFNTSDLPFMFRIEDFKGNPIDYSDFLFTSILHWEYEEDPTTKQLILKNHSISKLIKCPTHGEFMQYFTKDTSTYLCFNWNNEKIGGSIEEKFNYYFTFFVSFCPTGYYNPDTCTDPTEIDKISLSKNPWYFSLYYPEYYLLPSDLDNPLRIKYSNYLRRVSREMVKYDEFLFQRVVLNDDQGILWHTNKLITRIALYSRESEYYFYENTKETLIKNMPALLYQATILMSKDYDYYDRIYVKLQDVAAQIAGFLRIIIFVLVFFDVKASSLFLQASLVHFFFNFKNERSTQKQINNSINPYHLPQFLGKEVKQYQYLDLKKDEKERNLTSIKSATDFKLLMYSSIGKTLDEKRSQKEYNHNYKLLISILNYGLKFTQYTLCLTCKTNKEQGIKYRYAYEAIQDRMDIAYYFKIMLDLTFMKKLLFNDHQITAIDNCKRPNINNVNELSSFFQFYSSEEEVKKIRDFVDYYNLKPTNDNGDNGNMNLINNNIENNSVIDCLNNNDPSQLKVLINKNKVSFQCCNMIK